MERKAEFVQLADDPTVNMSQLCRRFGISRKTGYKWLRRYQQEGLEGLFERSRRPDHSPNKTPEQIPAASTITAILDRHEMLAAPEDPSRQGAWQRFERFLTATGSREPSSVITARRGAPASAGGAGDRSTPDWPYG